MKQKHAIRFIALAVVAILLAGCVHDFPTMTEDGEEGIDPTLVEVNTEVTLDLELVPLEIIAGPNRSGNRKAETGTKAAADYRRRFIIEAWREGKPESRQVTVMEDAEGEGEGEDGDEKITLPIHLRLHAVEYTLAVWTDYVAAGTDTDLYYDTKDLQYVACTDPYTGSTPYRDCLYGTAALDLRQYREEWNAKVQVKVDMVRPLAKYELIATDVEKFLEKTRRQQAAGKTYTITCSYSYLFPSVFDVLSGKPYDVWSDVFFTAPLTVTDNGNGECTIAGDYLFVNGQETSAILTIEVRDSDGKLFSHIADMHIPYRRGHLTTLKGEFLTSEIKGGIEIDPDYGDDIEINLDSLL